MISDRVNPLDDTCNPIIRACAPHTRDALLERGKLTPFDAESTVFMDGQNAGFVLFPVSGTLQMGKATARGRRQIICNPIAGSCGGICMLGFGDTALADAHGLEAGEAILLPRHDFEELIHHDPVLCHAAWESAASCMAHLSHLVAQLSFNKVAERVVQALLEDTAENGEMVHLTQADLAAEVGTTREVVARCLAALQADGLVRLGRARITVLDRAGLLAQL